MSATILDGKIVRDEIAERLTRSVKELCVKKKRPPMLAILQVGNNPESTAYIGQKKKFAERIGAEVRHESFPVSVSEDDVVDQIKKLNANPSIDGILLQIPLPANLDAKRIIAAIDPRKDVDGLTSANVMKLWSHKKGMAKDFSGYVPATAKAVLTLLDFYNIPIAGKHAVIIGRSELVGKPLFFSLLNRDATVTLCHSKSERLETITKAADILIVAAGKSHFIDKDFVAAGQTVIDVGINVVGSVIGDAAPVGKEQEEIPSRTLVGDVDLAAVKDIVSAVSPVPGGVGPLTVASLFENLIQAAEM